MDDSYYACLLIHQDEVSDSQPALTNEGFLDPPVGDPDVRKFEWKGPRTCNDGESSRSLLLRTATEGVDRGLPGDE